VTLERDAAEQLAGDRGAAPPIDLPAAAVSRGFVRGVLLRERQAVVGISIVAFFAAIALLAPLIAPDGPHEQVGGVYASPTGSHWLGLDDGGIDMLTLVMYGARISLLVGFAASLVAMVIGGGVGLLSGFFGGKVDVILMRITDYFLVIPDIPLMIVVAALFGRNLLNIILIIGVIYWTSTARLIRAQVKSVRERTYVKRAQALGATNVRLMRRHVLPQIVPLLIANTVLTIATAIFAETYISFLGLGDPSSISWGRLIQNSLTGGAIFHHAWWAIIPPGLCVTLLILACTIIGQSIEDALNPRLKVGHLAVRRFRLRPLAGRLDAE
jgi:peptide/nickel transport system permease protein